MVGYVLGALGVVCALAAGSMFHSAARVRDLMSMSIAVDVAILGAVLISGGAIVVAIESLRAGAAPKS